MGIKIISENRKARHDFQILDKYEAGLVLRGSEVKALRNQQCNLKDSYIAFRHHEAFLQNAHISVYKASSYNNHDPERLRKLLLHEHELSDISEAVQKKGLVCIPLKIYFKQGKVKLEIALAKSKKVYDKREDIKRRSVEKDLRRQLRHLKK